MNEIKIYLKTSGRIAELYKDFDLYEGCYRNSQMSVYVPKSLLYENEDGTFANLVKTGAILTAPNGTKLTTKSYYLDYVKTETVVGIVYAVYTITTPKEFCVYSGTQTVVVNVESIDNTDKDNQKIISVTTTQTVNLIVLESAYLGQDEPIEPTELDKIKATLTEIEGDITGLQSDVTEIKEDITGLQSKVSDLSEDKLDKVSGNTTYKQAYAKDTNGDQIMQNYSTENVTNAIVQRDETGNIKITPGRKGYMNDGATMRNIADVESEVAKKYDKTGGTIDGNVQITGDLNVDGTTTTNDTETLQVKDNFIVTNADGTPLNSLSGIVIRTNANTTYAIVYDPVSDSVKLGEGTYTDGKFTFLEGEGEAVAVRDNSTAFTDKHVIVWDAAGDKFVDGGGTLDEKLDKVTGTNTVPRAYTVTETGEQSMTDLNSGIAPYTIVYRNSAGYFDVLDPAQYTNPVSLRYYNQNVPIAVKNSYATQTALANTQRQVDGLYTLLEQKNEIYVQTATDTYTTRETAGGENIADGVQTPVKKITGKTVKTTNQFSITNLNGGSGSAGNALSVSRAQITVTNYYACATSKTFRQLVPNAHAGTYTIFFNLSTNGEFSDSVASGAIAIVDTAGSLYLSASSFTSGGAKSNTFTITEERLDSVVYFYGIGQEGITVSWTNLMIVEGDVTSAPPAYSPYFKGLKNASFAGIKSTGKNLFSGENVTAKNCTYENGVAKQIAADDSADFVWKAQLYKDTTFVSQVEVQFLNTGRIPALTFEKTSEVNRLVFGLNGKSIDTLLSIYISEFPNGTYTITWNVLNITQGSISWDNIMLNRGSSALPYEPYKQSVLSLPEAVELTEYDTAYPETGEIQRQSKTITFNGTENFFEYVKNVFGTGVSYTTIPEMICNHYFARTDIRTATNLNDKQMCLSTPENGNRFLFKDLRFDTLEEFKNHLAELAAAGNPLTVTYKTAEATTEQADFSADSYIAWKNGSETIEQGDTDNSEYGAENTVEQDYYLLTAPQEVTKE